MSHKRKIKSLVFLDNICDVLKIHSIGYNDFSQRDLSVFLCSNVWHALYYMESGSGKLWVDEQEYVLSEGCLFFLPPNKPIKFLSCKNNPIKYYWISFYPELAKEVFSILGFAKDDLVHQSRVPQKINQSFCVLLESQTPSPEVYFASLEVLMEIFSHEFSPVVFPLEKTRDGAYTENLKQLIHLNYDNPEFNIASAANMLYISHSQLSRIFKTQTGTTPIAYLIDIRLTKAAELLKKRNYTARELCDIVGYSNEINFMKSFKKKWGMTIKEYYKQASLNN